MTTTKSATLASAMATAFAQFEAAAKDANNPHFKSKYADLPSVIEAVKPALIANRLFFIQATHDVDGGVCIETQVHHESGESMSFGRLFVPASKNDAQGFGSALTYARRYSLMTAFGITCEDDDGNAAAKSAPARRANGVAAEAIDEAEAQADAEEPADDSDDAPEAATDESRVIRVSRVITAPASAIFALIADPAQQPRFDGNENLQEADEGQRVTAVGEKFLMTNTSGRIRENTIVEFIEDRLIAWKPSEVDKTPPGHLWRWELDPIDDDTTNVAHIYDWTGLDPDDEKRIERARSTTSESLLASVNRLAELVEADPGSESEKKPDDADAGEEKRPNIVRRTDG